MPGRVQAVRREQGGREVDIMLQSSHVVHDVWGRVVWHVHAVEDLWQPQYGQCAGAELA